MTTEIKIPKKLIEVALPLDDINKEAGREKSIRHGHPSTLHLWWARRPLAAARAILFAQLVNDPGYERHLGRGINKEKAEKERERLFEIIRKLVVWENVNDDEVLNEARSEIQKSWRETCELNKNHVRAKELFDPSIMPAFHDPFAGGGAIPFEAQRLGLAAYASDLNPVAVAINKAMIEIPQAFSGFQAVSGLLEKNKILDPPTGAKALASDILYYGDWIKKESEKEIGSYFSDIKITEAMTKNRTDLKHLVNKKLKIIAWIWTRTVKSPNPAHSHIDVPLASSFLLATKPGKEAYIFPNIKKDKVEFEVKVGRPANFEDMKNGTKFGRGTFRCVVSGTPISAEYVRAEGQANRMGCQLMAIVAEGERGRIYISPTVEQETLAKNISYIWKPDVEFYQQALGFRVGNYGLTKWCDLFTERQLLALNTFSDLICRVKTKILTDAKEVGIQIDQLSLENGGSGICAYADSVVLYLSFALDRLLQQYSTLAVWSSNPAHELVVNMFSRQTLSMTWDFGEVNPFCSAASWEKCLSFVAKNLAMMPIGSNLIKGIAVQSEAQTQKISINKVVSTDPPYYDNIGYADLSDYFYVWLRRTLKSSYPSLFSTLTVPKAQELVATPGRHGGRHEAEVFFLNGMTQSINRIIELAHPAFPISIYYAFKQAETDEDGTFSTGWEAFLQSVVDSGLVVCGTWPVRTERQGRMRDQGSNALASSIVLVCRKRLEKTNSVSRREFIRELNLLLPEALEAMTKGADVSPVAPVDLSQSIIGPGMAVFSRYPAVIEADGKPMTVRTALRLINRFLAEDDFDHDTQFCLSWFDQYGWDKGRFGDADVLARAKGTSVDGLRESGVIESSAGNLRILKWSELPANWTPENDNRISAWEVLHHLIRVNNLQGEVAAGKIVSKTHKYSELIRTLAYRLYTMCERKKWAEDASHYNNLMLAWDAIEAAAQEVGYAGTQISFFGDMEETKKENKKTKTGKRK